MAKENVKNFMQLINTDENLQEKLRAGMEAYTGNKSDERAVFNAVLVPLAKEAGYDFSYEEAEDLAGEIRNGELSEDELENVSGGWEKECEGGICLVLGVGLGTHEEVGGGGNMACFVFGVGVGSF